MIVGLGTGTTADFFLQALARELHAGRLHDVQGIATSLQSERRAHDLHIPLAQLTDTCKPDVTVDGADEVAPNLDLIKGLGGALLREKIIAQNSQRLIIIADASKRCEALGTLSPLPVEVVPFGCEAHEPYLRGLGCTPVLRRHSDGGIYRTDNGNYIYDCRFTRIDDPRRIENAILHRAGVMDCGLFLGMAHVALIADEHTVHQVTREGQQGLLSV